MSTSAIEKNYKKPFLREALKSAVAESHAQLEKLPVMQAYASGHATIDEYVVVTRVMQQFWNRFKPATQHLPIDYRQFFNAYLDVLEDDLGPVSPNVQVMPVHEIAFYYVILGSGLGAKVILKNNLNNAYPKQNLHYLASHSTLLWKEFIGVHLASVPVIEQPAVIEAARILFEELLTHMLCKTKVS